MKTAHIRGLLPLMVVVVYLAAVAVFCPRTLADPPKTEDGRITAVETKQSDLADKVKTLESENLNARMAVIEDNLSNLSKLMWFVIGGVALELILHAMRLKAISTMKNGRERESE